MSPLLLVYEFTQQMIKSIRELLLLSCISIVVLEFRDESVINPVMQLWQFSVHHYKWEKVARLLYGTMTTM